MREMVTKEGEQEGVEKETDQFLQDSIQFIEGKFFYGVQSRGIGDGCNIEGESDGSR